jgi:TetR/AcrR family transcriptional regulator, transcriptional repressor of aconitase
MTTISTNSAHERQQVVDAAVNCFIEHGIAAASMDDIIEESGLSPEVVHQHFATKNDILRVLGARNKIAAGGVLREVLQETPLPPVDEIVARVATFFEASLESGDPVGVAPQAWGVAMYDDEVDVIMRDVFADLRDLWIQLATRMADEGQLPDDADPQDVGRTLMAIVIGFMVQSLLSDSKATHVSRALQVLLR